jgi:hypothetical protein
MWLMSEQKPTRRWLQFSLRSLLLLMTAIIVVLVAWRTWFKPNEPIEVVVSIEDAPKSQSGPPTVSRYVITDKKLMRQLVLKPLSQAQRDPHSATAKYTKWLPPEALIELKYSDGAKEVLVLISCIQYMHGDELFQVDFRELRDFLRSQGVNWR